jgi:hypothetical protein
VVIGDPSLWVPNLLSTCNVWSNPSLYFCYRLDQIREEIGFDSVLGWGKLPSVRPVIEEHSTRWLPLHLMSSGDGLKLSERLVMN